MVLSVPHNWYCYLFFSKLFERVSLDQTTNRKQNETRPLELFLIMFREKENI
jgi:hypothetical protein